MDASKASTSYRSRVVACLSMTAILVGLGWQMLGGSSQGTLGMTMLTAGDAAPRFTARTSDGKTIELADHLGKEGLVLFFYPKDGTSVCTAEACAFRDSYEKFKAAGFEVIGVSSDSDQSHQTFADRNRLSFPLISDADGSLRQLFGVQNTFGIIPSRVTFVIDKSGTIKLAYSALLAADDHVKRALTAVNGEAAGTAND